MEKRVQNPSKKGPKGSGTLFGGVFAGFLALDASKKVFEHFLIDILCCLNILNKISKIEKKKTYCYFK